MKDNAKKQKNGQSEFLNRCLLIINNQEMMKNISKIIFLHEKFCNDDFSEE